MMKNSKLSKLLVAGVSVAMLASALAPMAFAEETSNSAVSYNDDLTVVVALYDKTTSGWVNIGNSDTSKAPVAGKTGWVTNKADEIKNETPYLVQFEADGAKYKVKESQTESINVDSVIDWTKLPVNYDVVGWKFGETNFTTTFTGMNTGEIKLKGLVDDSYTVNNNRGQYTTYLTIFVEQSVETDDILSSVTTDLVVANADITTAGSYNRDYGYKKAIEVDGDELNLSNVACLNDSIVVPSYKVADGYVWKDVKVEVSDNNAGSNPVITRTFKDMGSTIKLSDLGIQAYLDKATTSDLNDISISIKAEVEQKKGVMLTLSKDAWTLSKDAKGNDVRANSGKKVVVVNELDNALFTKYDGATGSEVYSDADVTLPAVVILDADDPTKADEDYTFLGWEVIKTDTNKLADSKKVAATYRFEDGVFSATVFETTKTPSDTKVTVVPVFSEAEEEEVITYGEMETPYDKVDWFINGEKQLGKVVWAQHYSYVDENGKTKGWEGGLFIDTKNGVAKMYSTVKKAVTGGSPAQQYFLDTNCNGAKEGYVFKDGVQDTTVTGILDGAYYTKGAIDVEAYGLKKIAGAEDDPFFYLVSDGVYQSDYNGMWEDEDGSVYKLEKGCTNTTFTGVYDRGDWALSVKDSKVQKDETGFVLYGEDQYWFINGICNMKETEAVREHTDGNFYYTVGAKIDFTFNGECNGHTFVNGVASK